MADSYPRAMLSPVRCRGCGSIFDLCKGEPVARYADCTVFITPCCGRRTDDRPGSGVEHLSQADAYCAQLGARINPDGSMSFG